MIQGWEVGRLQLAVGGHASTVHDTPHLVYGCHPEQSRGTCYQAPLAYKSNRALKTGLSALLGMTIYALVIPTVAKRSRGTYFQLSLVLMSKAIKGIHRGRKFDLIACASGHPLSGSGTHRLSPCEGESFGNVHPLSVVI